MAVNETQLVQLFEQVLTLSKVDASQSVAILKSHYSDARTVRAATDAALRLGAVVYAVELPAFNHPRAMGNDMTAYCGDTALTGNGGAACAGGRRPDRRYHDAAAFAGAGADPENRHPHPAGGGAAGGAGAPVAQRGGQGAGAGRRRRAGAGEADAGDLRRRQRFPRAARAIPDGDRVRLCR